MVSVGDSIILWNLDDSRSPAEIRNQKPTPILKYYSQVGRPRKPFYNLCIWRKYSLFAFIFKEQFLKVKNAFSSFYYFLRGFRNIFPISKFYRFFWTRNFNSHFQLQTFDIKWKNSEILHTILRTILLITLLKFLLKILLIEMLVLHAFLKAGPASVLLVICLWRLPKN